MPLFELGLDVAASRVTEDRIMAEWQPFWATVGKEQG